MPDGGAARARREPASVGLARAGAVLGDAVGRAGRVRPRGRRFGGLAWAGEGAGLRGSARLPAAPGRRADGVSKVTAAHTDCFGVEGNTYEPFRPPSWPGARWAAAPRRLRFRRLVPGRAESSPLGSTHGGYSGIVLLKMWNNTQDAGERHSPFPLP